MSAHYIIGIDLGTTNSTCACLEVGAAAPQPQMVPLMQVTEAGERQARASLPSFLYLPDGDPDGSLDLPWAANRDFCVGALARRNAATVPGKTVSSAKSWLCAANVDRLAPILPWNRNQPERQVSPVAAARLILEHLRDAWNHEVAGDDPQLRFEAQEINLTVPASFDAVARELTVQAAQAAGLEVTLLEEPQAAFYSWLETMGEDWRDTVGPGSRVLVCDIGGGTTDFSLIEVVDEGGNLALRRVAVGEHILLGGDNMDLTLAHAVARKLQEARGLRLDQWQLAGLTHACREAKEILCANPDAGPQRLTVLGRGSSLIGGTIATTLDFEECRQFLLDGFFPVVPLESEPQQRRGAGLRTFGLNYAADPAITRHLAAFLARHCGNDELPEAVLFNGGVTKATVMRERLVQVLGNWRGRPVRVLAGDEPDLAVSRGACWYGHVRRGEAIRIKAGSSHSYYVGIESSMPAVPGFEPPLEALCVVPFGMEEGTEADVPFSGLGLVVGETTEFRFFTATSRQEDELGNILPNADHPDLSELPPLATDLEAPDEATPPGTLVPVRLKTVLSDIGTLQVWCLEEGNGRSWQLEYELRGGATGDRGVAAAGDEGASPHPDATDLA